MILGDLDAKGINGQSHEEKRLGEVSRATLGHDQDVQPQARRVLMDTKVKVMKDQLIRAKAYLIWMDRAPSFLHGYYTHRIPILLLAFFIQFYNLNICFLFLLYEL
ncbi:hypothetical protein HanPI659440_Chr03g0127751 [Helianthus annuus]|nr:hypothetical protein HanPI659440_Chr03g0127751 [Helianthus annuus]